MNAAIFKRTLIAAAIMFSAIFFIYLIQLPYTHTDVPSTSEAKQASLLFYP